ncbi:MAG: carboxypeptidase-like regulatory domain-containing protein [Planctomycetota bacterium]
MSSPSVRKRRRFLALGVLACICAALVVAWRASRRPEHAPAIERVTASGDAEVALVEPASATGRSVAHETSAPPPALDPRIRVVALPAREPIPGARITVRARGVQEELIVTTNADGVATAPARDGPIDIGVSADGFFPIADVRESLRADADIEYALHTAGTLLVRVRGPDGSPVSNAFVRVDLEAPVATLLHDAGVRQPRVWPAFHSPRMEWRGATSAMQLVSGTDENGELVLAMMPCDVALRVGVSEVGAPLSAVTTIPSSSRRQEIEFRAFEHGCIRGVLQWSDGTPAYKHPGHAAPITRSRVAVQSLEPDDRGVLPEPTYCDVDGRFEICGLPWGDVRWRIELLGELARNTKIDAEVVDVGVIRLRAMHTLAVHVYTSAAPEGPLYASVHARIHHEGQFLGSVPVPHAGLVTEKVPAGNVQVDIVSDGTLLVSQTATVPCDTLEVCLDGVFAELRIENAPLTQMHSFKLRLHPHAQDGEQHDASSSHGIHVGSMYGPRAFEWDGSTLCLPMVLPGMYEVYLHGLGNAPRRLGLVTLVAGRTTTLVPEEDAPGTIHGTVMDAAGAPVARVPIAAMPAAFRRWKADITQTLSDEEGRFRFEHRSPGRWTVYPVSLGPFSHEARTVDVRSNASIELNFVGAALGRIVGRVHRDGSPVVSATVPIRSRVGAWSSASLTTKSDAEGRFTFDELFPGEYDLNVHIDESATTSYAALCRHVIVRAGETVEIDVDPDAGMVHVLVQRSGAFFTEWYYGMSFSSGGEAWLTTKPGDRTKYFAPKLDAGPALFLLGAPKDRATLLTDPTGWSYYAAYVADVPKDAVQVVARLDGADVVVVTDSPGVAMPCARLAAIGPYRDVFGPDDRYELVYVDEAPGRRRFPSIPVGATLRLVPSGMSNANAFELRVDSAREIVVRWPPRR